MVSSHLNKYLSKGSSNYPTSKYKNFMAIHLSGMNGVVCLATQYISIRNFPTLRK